MDENIISKIRAVVASILTLGAVILEDIDICMNS
jgi:hypothetical protein